MLHLLCREIVRLAGSIISVRQAVGHIAMLFTFKCVMLYLTEKVGQYFCHVVCCTGGNKVMANNRRGSEKLEVSVLFCNFVHATIEALCLTLYQH